MNEQQIKHAAQVLEELNAFINTLCADEFDDICLKNKRFEELIGVCHEICETTGVLGY